MSYVEICDAEWELISSIIDYPIKPAGMRGRPKICARHIANAILWVITTGNAWGELPLRYPSAPTARRRLREWRSNGALDQLLNTLQMTGRSFDQNQINRIKNPFSKSTTDINPYPPPEISSTPDLERVDCTSTESKTSLGQMNHPSGPPQAPQDVKPSFVHTRRVKKFTLDMEIDQTKKYVLRFIVENVEKDEYQGTAGVMRDGHYIARSSFKFPKNSLFSDSQEAVLKWAIKQIDDASPSMQ